MLEIQNVSKTFNAGTVNEKTALNGLNLKLNEGDFVTVIGGNGAGKSTMLNAVAGVWPIDEGKILIDGIDVTKLSEHQRAAYIGRVFQDPMTGTAATMQIEENLALAAPVLISRHNVVFRLFVQNLYHIPDDFRPLLQIRVNEADIFSGGVPQAGVNTRLLAEVPGEGDDLHLAVAPGVDFFQIVQRGVLTAVVNVDDFDFISAVPESRQRGFMKGNDIFPLVIAGDYQR